MQISFHVQNESDMWNTYNFVLNSMKDNVFPFHGTANWGEAGGHRSQVEVVVA